MKIKKNFIRKKLKVVASLMLTITFLFSNSIITGALTDSSLPLNSGLASPYGIAFDNDGNTYVAEYTGGKLTKIDSTGAKTSVAQNISQITGIARDNDGNIYIAKHGESKIAKIDPQGNVTTFPTVISYPTTIMLDGNGHLYIAGYGDGSIWKMDVNGSNAVKVKANVTSAQSLFGMALDGEGNIYVADGPSNVVKKIDTNGVITTFISGLSSPQGLTKDSNGNFYVTNNGTSEIIKFDSNGTKITSYRIPAGASFDVVFRNGSLYWGNFSTSSIYRLVGNAKTLDSTHIELTMVDSIISSVDKSAFRVNGVASNPTIIDASVSGAKITLTLSSPMATNDNISVDYRKTGVNNLNNGYEIDDFIELKVVNNVDSIKPVITIAGEANVTLSNGQALGETGATAFDNKDGDITNNIVRTIKDASGNTIDAIDTTKAGTYTIHYNVSDSQGNGAVEVIRTIIVQNETIKPFIALLGNSISTVANGQVYNDAGATALDNADGNITNNIVRIIKDADGNIIGAIDTTKAGTYIIHYNVSDEAGNAAVEVKRTVIVQNETTKPVISLAGNNILVITNGQVYNDPGAIALDNKDGNIANNIVKTIKDSEGNTITHIDTTKAGTYTIHYNVSDAAGNAAVEVKRTVIVQKETTKPVITLTGSGSVIVENGQTYQDAGATALDNKDGNITNNIVRTIKNADGNTIDAIDTTKAGTYIIHYNVSDAAENAAVEVIRTIVIKEAKKIEVNDKTSDITIVGIDGTTFDSSVSLIVIPINDTENSNTLAKAKENFKVALSTVGEIKGKELVTLYDISLLKDNVKIQPDGKIKVKIKIPENLIDRSGLGIVYIGDNGVVTPIEATVEGGYIIFTTTHFSEYGIVANSINTDSIKEAPKTGDKSGFASLTIAGLLLSTFGIVFLRRKKELN